MKSRTCRRAAGFALSFLVLSCGLISEAANLLLNPGFETEYPAGKAANWWWYSNDSCGRATWAALSGVAGNAFFAEGRAEGGFGQDMGIDPSKGNIFAFNIFGRAEPNYTNGNTTIAMEFYIGAVLSYTITRNVYASLDAARGSWVFLTLTHTNTVPGINVVKVRCDYANGGIPFGATLATCQWDDGRFYQTQLRTSSVPQMAKYEPVSGAYLGVLLDRGGTAQEIAALNQNANKRHAVYAKFVLFGQDPFPWDWVNTVKTNCPGAAVHLILEPMVGFTNFYAADWGPGQATYDAALSFASNCALADMPVFLRFGHEANGDWYPWHPQYSVKYNIPDTVSNETYIIAWRNFANIIHSNAPNVVMVWAPNQGNGPDPLPFYEDVYPGDQYVDWVGMSVYNGQTYGNGNEVLDFQFKNAIEKGYWQENDRGYDDTFENFYWTFSDPDNPEGHHKPMMIAETAAAFEPKYFVTNQILIAGFEALEGPSFSSSNTLAQFQRLNSDGFLASNQTWVDGFDTLSTWNWGPWGTNGYTWQNSTNAVEGTNAIVMSGQPEAGGVYVGGNGRVIGSVPFYPAATIAQFQDLDSDGLVTSNSQWIDGFEIPSLWNWGPWNNVYWSNTTAIYQGTNAVIIGASNAFSGAYIGGNGRSSFASGSSIPVNRLANFQSLSTNGSSYKDQDWWPAGADCTPWNDPSDANGGTCTWTLVSDEYADYPTNSLRISGTDANTNGYIGGNAFSATGVDRDWSEATHIYLVSRRASDANGNPVLRVELNDGGSRTAIISRVIETTYYDWSLLAISNMAADAGFVWTNVTTVKLLMLAQTNGVNTADLYLKQFQLNHQSVGSDMSAFNGMVLWVKRAGVTNREPLLAISLRSPIGTATVSKVITSTSYYPLKIPFGDMAVSPGFSWANVTAYTIELLTTADGEAPDPVYLDKWSACRMTNAPYKDQDWGDPGPSHAPWGDAEDTNGGFHSWALVADAYTGYPVNSLKLSGADRNTNNYVGGNGFFTRPEDRDWSVSSHIALLARNGGDTSKADPLLRLELIDSGSRTASASQVVSASLYSRVLMARSNMTVDTGFVWTNVLEVKLHMLTGTPGVDPNDVYLKEIQIGSISNQTPVDWSAFNGIEMYVRRADDTNAHPMLGINIRSRTTDTNYVASAQRVVTGTEWYPLRVRFGEMSVSSGFQWTNITALILEMLTSEAGKTPAALYIDKWNLVNLTNEPYADQDWWPQGTNIAVWSDDTDTNGGWHTWSIVEEPLDGYPTNALRMSGTDANTNFYVGGNGFSLRDADKDWSRVTYMSLLARRGDITNAEPMLLISLLDATGTHTAQATQVIVATNYMALRIPFRDMTVSSGFQWTNVSSVTFEMLTGTPGRRPSDMYLKEFQIGTASNEYEQDWWTAGTGYQPWGDSMWTQTTDAAVGQYALRISGAVTNDSQWYIGGNGCSIPVAQQNWSNSDALVFYAKRGNETNKVYPKFKITLDNDYSETNGNEAIIESRVANSNYYEMVIAFDDFLAGAGFAWTNIRMFKIEYFTGDGGKQPNDLYIDHLQRKSITLTNGADNIKWKHDWCDQLYALENFQDSDPADPDQNPDYVSIFERFRNVHMINWFHVKKFEDGITKDLKIAADGTNGGVVYASYYDRIKEPYFLTNIVMDMDGDGMSDSWELRYFNGPTNANALSDRDFDGLSNWDEYLAGSNPTNDDSVLEMNSGTASSGGASGFVIQWQSESWRMYSLEWSTNLNRSFGARASRIMATPPINAYTDTVTGVGPYFYRVKVLP